MIISSGHRKLPALDGFQYVKGAQQFAAIVAGDVHRAALAIGRDRDSEAAPFRETRIHARLLHDTKPIDQYLRFKRTDFALMRQQNPFKPRHQLGRRAFFRIGFWHLMPCEDRRQIKHRPSQGNDPLACAALRRRTQKPAETRTPDTRAGQVYALRDVLAKLTGAAPHLRIGRFNTKTFNQRHRTALHQHHRLRIAGNPRWLAPGQRLHIECSSTQISPHRKPRLPIAAGFIAKIKLHRPCQQRSAVQAKCCQLPGIGAGGDDFARHNIVRPAIAEIRLLLDAGFNIAKYAGAGCRQPRIAQ